MHLRTSYGFLEGFSYRVPNLKQATFLHVQTRSTHGATTAIWKANWRNASWSHQDGTPIFHQFLVLPIHVIYINNLDFPRQLWRNVSWPVCWKHTYLVFCENASAPRINLLLFLDFIIFHGGSYDIMDPQVSHTHISYLMWYTTDSILSFLVNNICKYS